MDDFLRILIYSLNTVDGEKDSANFIKNIIEKRKQKIFKSDPAIRQRYNHDINKYSKLTEEEQINIYRTTFMKYKIIRFRQKISFMAFREHKFILEFILSKFGDRYTQLVEKGELPKLP